MKKIRLSSSDYVLIRVSGRIREEWQELCWGTCHCVYRRSILWAKKTRASIHCPTLALPGSSLQSNKFLQTKAAMHFEKRR